MSHHPHDHLSWLPPVDNDFRTHCKNILAGEVADKGALISRLATAQLSAPQAAKMSRIITRNIEHRGDVGTLSHFKLGVLTNATFDLVSDWIPVSAARYGVAMEIVDTPYDQILQQALDEKSTINQSGCDGILLAIDHRWLNVDETAFSPVGIESQLQDCIDKLTSVVEALSAILTRS